MKVRTLIYYFLISTSIVLSISADEPDYWKEILKLHKKEGIEKKSLAQPYIEKLSSDQIIVASKQCCEYISKNKEYDEDRLVMMSVSNCIHILAVLPARDDWQKSFEKLLPIISDTKGMILLRTTIVHIFGERTFRDALDEDQRKKLWQSLEPIIKNGKENMLLRISALNTFWDTISDSYRATILSDKNVIEYMGKKGSKVFSNLVSEIRVGNILLDVETIKESGMTKMKVNELMRDLVKICREKDADLNLQRSIYRVFRLYTVYYV